jgi:AbrB family looped-hinge helix DNA binding protein
MGLRLRRDLRKNQSSLCVKLASPKKLAVFDKYATISEEWHTMTETVTLGESGRIVLPATIRKEFGLKTGDRLTIAVNGNKIEILSMDMALKEIRDSIIQEHGSLDGLLDEFLAERRAEAARE